MLNIQEYSICWKMKNSKLVKYSTNMCQSSPKIHTMVFPSLSPKFAFPTRLSHRKGLGRWGGEYVYGKAYFQVFPKACISQASFHSHTFQRSSYGKGCPKPFPEQVFTQERLGGEIWKGLFPSLSPTIGKGKVWRDYQAFSTWRQKEAMENESTLASFSNQLTKAKKSFLLDYQTQKALFFKNTF